MAENKSKRLQVRITPLQMRRIETLMEKKALDVSSIVNNAIKEMFDREVGELREDAKRSAKRK